MNSISLLALYIVTLIILTNSIYFWRA